MKYLLLVLFCFQVLACSKNPPAPERSVDVVLVGGGIMSATLGTLLKDLEPGTSMEIFERLDKVAAESSAAWNNAGTGHSAFCELNYTPELTDGTIETKKAVDINEQFEISKQFWAYQVNQKNLTDPRSFINNVPHMSFVIGADDVAYLKKRHEALQHHSLFRGMEYSEDPAVLMQWVPLMMEGRDPADKVAATRMEIGTDVNFGALTNGLISSLVKDKQVPLHTSHDVQDIVRNEDSTWTVVVKNLTDNKVSSIRAKFVFIGAGGGSLKLLEKSGIPEAKGYGGLPVGGEWLATDNPKIVERHQAKAYGKPSLGAPPMSVPHLDTRVIDGKKALLFGPFATFSTKFLKQGSLWDLFGSLNSGNIIPMMQAGWDNLDLARYLVGQLMLNKEQQMEALKRYLPNANNADWRLEIAGQRVQVVKNDPEKGGILQFGTEIVSSADGSIVALLGASPGASTAAPIMLKVIEKSFKEKVQGSWAAKLKEIIPSYGQKLDNNIELTNSIREMTSKALQLKHMPVAPEPAVPAPKQAGL